MDSEVEDEMMRIGPSGLPERLFGGRRSSFQVGRPDSHSRLQTAMPAAARLVPLSISLIEPGLGILVTFVTQ